MLSIIRWRHLCNFVQNQLKPFNLSFLEEELFSIAPGYFLSLSSSSPTIRLFHRFLIQFTYSSSLVVFIICVPYSGSLFRILVWVHFSGSLFSFLIQVPYSGFLFRFLIRIPYLDSLFGFLIPFLIWGSFLGSLSRCLIWVHYLLPQGSLRKVYVGFAYQVIYTCRLGD